MPALESRDFCVRPSLRSVFAVCGLLGLLPGCDRVQGMFSDAEPEAAKAEAKAETKAEAKAAAGAPEAPAAGAPAAGAPEAAPAAGAPAAGAPAAGAPAVAVTTTAAVPEAAAAAADQPCIVGSWDAIEYTAAVRHAIAKDPQLRSMKKTSSGGHITYVVAPPSGTSGKVTATADHLKYGFSGKVEGYPVRVDIDINGETEATYELPGEGSIVISKPERNTMKVKANAKVQGLGAARQADKVDLDFDGSFVYECSEKELKVWRGSREADAMVFARKAAG
jgi:hypothetical protein